MATPKAPAQAADAPMRVRRASAGTLLLAERDTRAAMDAALDESVDLAVADMTRRQRDTRIRNAVLLSVVLLGAKRMTGKVRDALLDGRQRARARAADRARAELVAAGLTGALAALVLGREQLRYEEDHSHATSAAEALVAAWQSMAVHLVLRAKRREEDAAQALAETRARLESRANRTATTESAQAYNGEHAAAVEDAAQEDHAFKRMVSDMDLVRMWDSMFDMRTCLDCREMHGEIAEVGDTFRGGLEPGFVHPNCRCLDIVVTRAAALKLAA